MPDEAASLYLSASSPTLIDCNQISSPVLYLSKVLVVHQTHGAAAVYGLPQVESNRRQPTSHSHKLANYPDGPTSQAQLRTTNYPTPLLCSGTKHPSVRLAKTR